VEIVVKELLLILRTTPTTIDLKIDPVGAGGSSGLLHRDTQVRFEIRDRRIGIVER
jgi:hypothetical protein